LCHFFTKWGIGTGFRNLFLRIFLFVNLNHPIMKRETLEMLMLPELCDLLVENTILLLDSIEKKADGITIRDLKKKVEVIQEIIRKKRTEEAA
jgi:hypothetical protein